MGTGQTIDFAAGEQATDEQATEAAEKPAEPKRQTNGRAKRRLTIRCEHCSTSRKAVTCEPDEKRPGWVKCPKCNWRHKPPGRLLTRGQRLKSERSAR